MDIVDLNNKHARVCCVCARTTTRHPYVLFFCPKRYTERAEVYDYPIISSFAHVWCLVIIIITVRRGL